MSFATGIKIGGRLYEEVNNPDSKMKEETLKFVKNNYHKPFVILTLVTLVLWVFGLWIWVPFLLLGLLILHY